MPSITTLFSRLLIVLLGAASGLIFTASAASANPNAACDGTHHSDTGHGANRRGAYDETCDGSPSANGNGDGAAKGKPCAGCVGNADDKNPRGQQPNGSDRNAGYECDRNKGVGRTNPAHTGCRAPATAPTSNGATGGGTTTKPLAAPTTPTPPACPAGSTMVDGACVSGSGAVKPSGVADQPVSFTTESPRVLGVQYARSTLLASTSGAGAELARAYGELASTGSNSAPDLVPLALALVAFGTLLARFGRSREHADA